MSVVNLQDKNLTLKNCMMCCRALDDFIFSKLYEYITTNSPTYTISLFKILLIKKINSWYFYNILVYITEKN